MCINNSKNNISFSGGNKRALDAFYNPNAVVPTLLIETGVTLGRSKEAYKRGGKIEASERLVEQGTSALVWIFGVQILKKIGEGIGKNLFGLKNLDFDIGFDELRNPIKNNLSKAIDSKTALFKSFNLLAATALATYFIGFILPKINHRITKGILSKDVKNSIQTLRVMSFDEYRTKAKNKTLTNKNNINNQGIKQVKKPTKLMQNLSFSSSFVNSLAHTIENNSAARLLITDTGVIGGRYKNGRNKYERIEGLFRDIASIYFYLFSTNHVVRFLNKITGNTDINPKAVDITATMLSKKFLLGMKKEDFLEGIKDNISKEDEQKLFELFNGRKVVGLEEFTEIFKEKEQKAILMSELQPVFNDKRFLSYRQAYDVISSSWLSNPEFLKEVESQITNGKSSDSLRFVSSRYLDKQRQTLNQFANQIILQTKTNKITKKEIKRIARKTINRNFGFYALGTLFSAFALGIIIPKVQYAITKKLTNQDKFPGIEQYNNQKTKEK